MLKHLRQLASESLVYGLAGTISRFLGIFLVPIYTRIFTPEDYGVLSLVASTMAVVSIFSVLALDSAAGRWFWETEEEEDRRRTIASWAWCQLAVSAALAALMFAAADWLGRRIVGRGDAGLYFRLVALTLPLSVLGAVLINWLRMQRRPWATMLYTLGTSVAGILLSILLVVFLGWGLAGVYWAQIATLLVASAIAARLMRGWVSPRYFRWDRLRAMLRFAFPLIPAALAFWVVGFSDRYFVQAYRSTDEVGLYHIGSSLAAVVALVTTAFQQAWGPFAFSIHKQPDARRVYANVFLAYLWITCAVCTALTLFAPEVIRLVATEQYLGASTVVGFLSFSYVMMGLTYIASTGPGIMKTSAPTGAAVTVAAGLNLLFNFILVPWMGKVGSALATLLSQAVVPIYLFRASQRLYPIPYRFKAGLALLATAGLLVCLGTVWRSGSVWLDVAVKAGLVLLFLLAPFALGIVTPLQLRRLLRAAPQSA
jgi:O-antigen/teichoic acid export membrane protein